MGFLACRRARQITRTVVWPTSERRCRFIADASDTPASHPQHGARGTVPCERLPNAEIRGKLLLTGFAICTNITSTVSEVPVEFSIDPSSRLPICRQLSNQIREAVARGKLQPDARLPSVRELSRSVVVNPNTIARVYSDLEREGTLNTRPGLGVFVARPRADLSRKARRERLREALGRFLTDAVHLGCTADEVAALVSEEVKQFQWYEKES